MEDGLECSRRAVDDFFALVCNVSGADLQGGSLHVAQEVIRTEHRVVLRVDGGKEAGDLGRDVHGFREVLCIHVLQTSHHAVCTLIIAIEQHKLVRAVNTGGKNELVVHGRIGLIHNLVLVLVVASLHGRHHELLDQLGSFFRAEVELHQVITGLGKSRAGWLLFLLDDLADQIKLHAVLSFLAWRQFAAFEHLFEEVSIRLDLLQLLDRFPDDVRLRIECQPESGVGLSQGQTKHGIADAVAFCANNHALVLHRNVRENLVEVDLFGRTGARLGCLSAARVASTLRHHLVDAVVRIITHERDVVLEHVTPAVDGVLSLDAVLNQHVLHLGQSLVHALGHSIELTLAKRLKVLHVLDGVGRLHAGASIGEARVALGDDTVGLWCMTVEQVLTHLALSDAVLLHQLNRGLQLVGQVVLSALGHAAVIGALTLKCVELASHALAGCLDRIHNTLEVDLLVHPVVEELVAELQRLGVHGCIPCAVHRLIQNALAAVVDGLLAFALDGFRVGNRRLRQFDLGSFPAYLLSGSIFALRSCADSSADIANTGLYS